MVELLAFPIITILDAFTIRNRNSPFTTTRCAVSWMNRDATSLTLALNCQIKNNMLDFDQLESECINIPGLEKYLVTTNYIDDKIVKVKNYYINTKQKEEQCGKFLIRKSAYLDVFWKDDDVMNQKDWDVQTYAVVALYNNKYIGHIYTWVSPIDTTLCFAMGIRGRIDQIFAKERIRNVSTYLIEGVRRFAVAKECRMVIVTYPFATMVPILKGLGFQQYTTSVTLFQRSLAGKYVNDNDEIDECVNCYGHNLEEIPITINTTFVLI